MTNFSPRFTYEIDAELPPDGSQVYCFPPEEHIGASLIVQFNRMGRRWTGMFFEGRLRGDVTTVAHFPDPDFAVVVVGGRGYVVNVAVPGEFTLLRPWPTRQLIEEKPTVLYVCGLNRVAAYGREGLLWESDRLVLDWLQLDFVSEKYLHCRGNIPGATEFSFRLDKVTGVPLESAVREVVSMFGPQAGKTQ